MSSRCKFDIGNCEFGRLAKGTFSGAIRWAKLSGCETAGGKSSTRERRNIIISNHSSSQMTELSYFHDGDDQACDPGPLNTAPALHAMKGFWPVLERLLEARHL